MMRIRPRLLALLTLLLGLVHAQDLRFDPTGIIVNPDPSFTLDVRFDRSGSLPSYQVGEEIQVLVRSDRDAFVYLFALDPDGSITQIVPNAYSDDNVLFAGETKRFPGPGAGYRFTVSEPLGTSSVLAVASIRPLPTNLIVRFLGGAAFATSDEGLSSFREGFRDVIAGIPQGNWVTSVARYRVLSSAAPAPSGETDLFIDSTPTGAQVYLDGAYQGVTPLRLVARSGTRTLELTLDGYAPYRTTLRLQPGGREEVDVTLDRAQRLGMLNVESNPRDAAVYVDGRYVGQTPLTRLDLAPGRYRVEVERSGYTPVTRTVTIAQGRTTNLRVTLLPELGRLVVLGDVPGTSVFVDGRLAGTLAPGSADLDAGSFEAGEVEVTLVAPGYATVVRRVVLSAGETRSLVLQQTPR